MQALHIVLLATTASAFIVAAAPGSRVGSGSEHGRLITLVVSGAAVVGNAASLMPGTPGWYARAMIVITFAVVVWALVGLVTGRRGESEAVVGRQSVGEPRVVRQAPAQRTPISAGARGAAVPAGSVGSVAAAAGTSGPAAAAAAASMSGARPGLYAVPEAEIVDAEIVEDDGAELASGPGARLRVATQETFEAAGPRRAGAIRGETYVAAHLGDYLPRRKQHLVSRRSRTQPVADGDLRTRLTRAYAVGLDPRGSLASHQA